MTFETSLKTVGGDQDASRQNYAYKRNLIHYCFFFLLMAYVNTNKNYTCHSLKSQPSIVTHQLRKTL